MCALRRRVLVVNQYAAPDTTPSAHYVSTVASALADAGMDVTLLAAEPSYGESAVAAPLRERRYGVNIRRVRMGSWRGRATKRRRFGGYVRFLAGALVLGRQIVRVERPDVVMCFSNPPFVALLAAWLARRAGARMMYVIHDVHPDILAATDWIRLPAPAVRAWDLLNRLMLKSASSVVVLGEGMKQLLVTEKGVAEERVQVVPLWAEPELERAELDESVRGELGVARDELLVLSTGNLGVMHSLDPVVVAVQRLKDRRVRFAFVASGVRLNHWEALLGGFPNVSFVPYRTGDPFRRLVAACDVGLVPLTPGMERFAVPSRAYTFLSAGRPLLTVMDPKADVARLVIENQCGFNSLCGVELAEWLERMLKDRAELRAAAVRARRTYEARFTRKAVLGQYVEMCLG